MRKQLEMGLENKMLEIGGRQKRLDMSQSIRVNEVGKKLESELEISQKVGQKVTRKWASQKVTQKEARMLARKQLESGLARK